MKQLVILLVLGTVALVGGYFLAKSTPDTTTSPSVAASLPPASDSDWSRGPKEAKATVIEYLDFQCPSCAQTAQWFDKLVADHPTDVRYIVRYFPLPQHQNALPSAKAAEAAGQQGKFFEMMQLEFSRQNLWAETTTAAATFEQYAAELGLNIDKFKNDRDSQTTANRINAGLKESESLGLPGTPSIFLNGKMIQPTSQQNLEELVNTALK